MLLGETGTGKTIAARAIHELSGRKGPFVHVNGAAIPDTMAESLLFGHKAGSFSDARSDSPGWFRSANGGTLFLDEVGLLSPATQARLLLAVESRSVTPLGASPVPVDVRLIVATNEDLAAAISAGRFRSDMYARLDGVSLTLPPLRDRKEDILPLLRLHLSSSPPMSAALVEQLLCWHWPFNVRELEKVAFTLQIRGESLPVWGPELLEDRLSFSSPAEAMESPGLGEGPPDREQLIELLRGVRGNVSELARQVQRSTKQIYRWCARHGLDPAHYR
jgi:DNA-binding NtrC family response regulator